MRTVLSINELYAVLCVYLIAITEFISRSWLMGKVKRVPGQEQDLLVRSEVLLPPQPGMLCVPCAKGMIDGGHQLVALLWEHGTASPFLPLRWVM